MSDHAEFFVKSFFTLSEWDLIHSLVSSNKDYCEDSEEDPRSDYESIENKIYKLFENK